MAKGLNAVTLKGNLGDDPKVKFTQQGRGVATMSVATTETWKDGAGKKQERTDWHRVVVWGKPAELCGEYLRKGSSVLVTGRLQYEKWEKDGVKMTTAQIVADDIFFLDRAPGREPSDPGRPVRGGDAWRESSTSSSGQGAPPPGYGPADEDIPF